jgi:osmotically inducible protein OsmC
MPIRHAQAHWQGTLKEGSGRLKVESGAFEGPYTWADRFADGGGANPEELIGAAHAGCYSMFLSAIQTRNGKPPARIDTRAAVHPED